MTSTATSLVYLLRSFLATLLVTLAFSVPTDSAALAADTKPVDLINNFNRQKVIDAYLQDFKPQLSVPLGWTGDAATCVAGATSAASKKAQLAGVNYMRAMADLPPVSISPTLSKQAQAGALISDANGFLTHYPSSKSKCFSKLGYTGTSHGNLALGNTAASAIAAYMHDYGDNNKIVGHRRWILYPRLTQIGTGDTSGANNLVVLGGKLASRKSQWVTWPTAGYFPRELEPGGRWSISYANADFRFASVSVKTKDGNLKAARNVKNGYGDNTLAWDMTLPESYVDGSADYEVVVTVSKIRVAGKNVTKVFRVTLVDADPTVLEKPNTPPTGDGSEDLLPELDKSAEAKAGYLRPKLTFIGATTCEPDRTGWVITLKWTLSEGNFRAEYNQIDSGLVEPGQSWQISDRRFVETNPGSKPTGKLQFATKYQSIWFFAMNGAAKPIDIIVLPEWTTADLTGLCP